MDLIIKSNVSLTFHSENCIGNKSKVLCRLQSKVEDVGAHHPQSHNSLSLSSLSTVQTQPHILHSASNHLVPFLKTGTSYTVLSKQQ